jgi:peptide/nickel transport system ATP-binding protein
MSAGSGDIVLQVEDLHTYFPTRDGVIEAVRGVSFTVRRGQVLGLVGESGSGKTVTGFSILGMVDPPGRVVRGRIMLHGRDLTHLPEAELRALRGNRIAMIFQDPLMTLNPVLRIETQMVEAIGAHRHGVSQAEARAQACGVLGRVGIPSPGERLRSYPHELSGGMRQRVAIAIAMLNRPDLIIADEPTTALDVTIQAQILFEMQKLARETGTALLWITHDLSILANLADDVAVMYAGQVVETGSIDTVLDAPRHPYTKGLLNSVPSRNRRGTPLRQIPGTAPAANRLPAGCGFHPRCGRAIPPCLTPPDLVEFTGAHYARCFNPEPDPAHGPAPTH